MGRSDDKLRRKMERLEREAVEHPARHRLRLASVVMLGYAYPVFMLLLGVVLVPIVFSMLPIVLSQEANQGEIFFVWLLGLGLAVWLAVWIVQAMMFEIDSPPEALLHPDAKAIAGEVESVRKAMGVGPVHDIRIGYQFNASVRQYPKWMVFGRARNELTIGMPMLGALTRDELRSLLAHELGHLGGNHGHFTAWIFRVNVTWERLASSSNRRGARRWNPFTWFPGWYSNWLFRMTLPLRRRHEYEADGASARLVGDELTARSLLKIYWLSHRQDRDFIPRIRSMVIDHDLPPNDFVQRLFEFLRQPDDVLRFADFVKHELRVRTHIHHEHPCLAERLAAISQAGLLNPDAAQPLFADESESGLELLGKARDFHTQRANTGWKNAWIGGWRYHHSYLQSVQKKKKTKPVVEDGKPVWEDVQVMTSYLAPSQAEPLLRSFIGENSGHAEALRALGDLLLDAGDERGIELTEKAIECASEARMPGLVRLLEYFRAIGDDRRADEIIRRLEDEMRVAKSAQKERRRIRSRDQFEPHQLDEEAVDKIRRLLRFHPRIRTAWLVRKKVSIYADKPAYVLGIVCSPFQPESDKWLAGSIPDQLTIPCTVVVLGLAAWRMRARMERIPGSLIMAESKL